MFSSCTIQDVDLVKVNGYNLARANDDKIKLTLNIKIDNPNNFKIKVKKTNLNLHVNGSDAGMIELNDKVIILKKTESDYDFVLYADSKKVTKAHFSTLSGYKMAPKILA